MPPSHQPRRLLNLKALFLAFILGLLTLSPTTFSQSTTDQGTASVVPTTSNDNAGSGTALSVQPTTASQQPSTSNMATTDMSITSAAATSANAITSTPIVSQSIPQIFNLNITSGCALNCLAQIPNAGQSLSTGTLTLASVTLLCTDKDLRTLVSTCVSNCGNVSDTSSLQALLTVCGSLVNAVNPTQSSVSLPTARVSQVNGAVDGGKFMVKTGRRLDEQLGRIYSETRLSTDPNLRNIS
ncbi:hypothetical protein HDU76_005019 [Blyttiomyces sp. JEL0837]|nr:hypothetical protein HDU76_005019 [Blyttiomyces sp. JEL0837]